MIRWVATLRTCLLWIALAALGAGCGTVSGHLEELVGERRYHEVIQDGMAWIRDRGGKVLDEDERAERDRIVRWVGVARLEVAKSKDTVQSYQEFAALAEGQPVNADLVVAASKLEAAAFYRDVTLARPGIMAFREYRERYPKGADVSDSRSREAEIALRDAIDAARAEALQEFRDRYGAWTEAADPIARSRVAEVELVLGEVRGADTASRYRWFLDRYGAWAEAREARGGIRERLVTAAEREARADGTLDAIREFRSEFAEWPEAASAMPGMRVAEVDLARTLALASHDVEHMRAFRTEYGGWAEATEALDAVYAAEAALSLELARAAGDIEALERGLGTYDREPWTERFERAIAERVLAPVLKRLARGGLPNRSKIKRFLEQHVERPRVREVAAPHAAALWKVAEKAKDVLAYRLFWGLYPDHPKAAKAREREREIAWAQTERGGAPASYQWFIDTYPDDRRASEAERRFFNLQRIARAANVWPRATITHRRERSDGTWELSIDVRDCFNGRVPGLTRGVFDVFNGSQDAEIVEFRGLEDERAVDVVVDIDLSGSMAQELDAVRHAIVRFAETMDFRGRAARFGLVTFGTDLVHVHPPNRDVRAFQRWIAETRTDASGMHEDAVHAMAASADFPFASSAERVVLVFTDEHLQTNTGGRAALGMKTDRDCQRAAKGAKCVEKCVASAVGAKRLGCLERCLSHLPQSTRRGYNQCRQRKNKHYCLERMPWARLQHNMHRCGGDVPQSSPVMDKLVAHLDRRAIRSFFFIPTDDRSESMAAFATLASRTDGTIKPVPQDERSSAPYEAALMELADQLSKQYFVRVRPVKGAPAGTFAVTVRNDHLWRGVTSLPAEDVLTLAMTSPDPSCAEVTLVTAEHGVYATIGCGKSWKRVDLPTGVQLLAGASGARPLLVVTGDGRLLRGRLHGAALAVDAEAPADVVQAVTDAAEGTWLITRDADGLHSLHHRAGTSGSYRAIAAIPPSEIPPTLIASPGRACVLTSNTERRCGQPEARTWPALPVRGLSRSALGLGATVAAIPGRLQGLLLAGADGSVYRSIDGGLQWSRVVLATGPRPRALTWIPGKPTIVCAASDRTTDCSDDLGRNWHRLGRAFERQAQGHLSAIDGTVYLAQADGLFRLERLVSRDIPSSSVFFATNSHEPSGSMHPFLRSIADTMRQDETLTLRIEGHADSRGSAEHNEELAGRRAESVAAFIRGRGVDPSRVEAVSFGERRPLSSRGRVASHARNRRVELILLRELPAEGRVTDPCAGR